jgi:hypothetical protein
MKTLAALVLASGLLFGQSTDSSGMVTATDVGVGHNPSVAEITSGLVHPVHVVVVHDGIVTHDDWTHNIRTSAGTTWQYNQMAGTTAAVGNYVGLTATAITPAQADTSLSGEITTNGLGRSSMTVANLSGTLTVPSAPTATPVGTTGAITYYYWAAACGNGPICTTPSATSGGTTSANATLSATNYNSVTFTGQLGATSYQLYRTTSNSQPSGTASILVGGTPACSVSGTVVSCTWNDVSNTLSSVVIPSSNLTNFGEYSLAHTWTATGTQSVQAGAVFNAASSGTMPFEFLLTNNYTLFANDTITITEYVYF